jgi:hypothetical protein
MHPTKIKWATGTDISDASLSVLINQLHGEEMDKVKLTNVKMLHS